MPVPLRVLALFIVVSALVLTTLATALADSHPAAADGQRLEDQSAEVQALYRAVYGDDAEARWIAEHNAAIGMSMMMGDSMDDMSNMYYDRIVAVAMARGADADLANRIAADVISRGTEAEFLAGTDAGVLYGIGESEDSINAPPGAPAPAPAAAASTTASTSSIDDWGNQSVRYVIGQTVSLTLPTSDDAAADSYALTGTLPGGLTYDADTRTISGVPTEANAGSPATVTYSAQNDTPADIGEPFTLSLTITVRTVDTAPRFADGTEIDDISIVLTQGIPKGTTLPAAIGGNNVAYSADGLPEGATLEANRTLSGTPTEMGTFDVTYTAKDEDDEEASLSFTITVAEDIDPVAPAIANMTFEEGATVGVRLPVGSGGNGALTYATTGHDDAALGLTFNVATRWLSGTIPALADGVNSLTRTITYTVSDSFLAKDTDDVMFTITVTASE